MVYYISKQHTKATIFYRKSIKIKFTLPFEEFVVSPKKYLKKICSFLNTTEVHLQTLI